MLTDGLFLLDDTISSEQEDYLVSGDLLAYLQATPCDYLYEAMLYLTDNYGFNVKLWDFAYSYATSNYCKFVELLLKHHDCGILETGLFVKVYRGETPDSSPLDTAYSWTTSRKVAESFAKMHYDTNCYIYSAYVDTGHIIRHIDLRNEEEVLIRPSSIESLSRTPLYSAFSDDEVSFLLEEHNADSMEHLMVLLYLQERSGLDTTKISTVDWSMLKSSLHSVYGNFMSLSNSEMAYLGLDEVNPVLSVSIDLAIIEALRELEGYSRGDIFIHSEIYCRYMVTLASKTEGFLIKEGV